MQNKSSNLNISSTFAEMAHRIGLFLVMSAPIIHLRMTHLEKLIDIISDKINLMYLALKFSTNVIVGFTE